MLPLVSKSTRFFSSASRLLQFSNRSMDNYARMEASDAAAATASIIFYDVGYLLIAISFLFIFPLRTEPEMRGNTADLVPDLEAVTARFQVHTMIPMRRIDSLATPGIAPTPATARIPPPPATRQCCSFPDPRWRGPCLQMSPQWAFPAFPATARPALMDHMVPPGHMVPEFPCRFTGRALHIAPAQG